MNKYRRAHAQAHARVRAHAHAQTRAQTHVHTRSTPEVHFFEIHLRPSLLGLSFLYLYFVDMLLVRIIIQLDEVRKSMANPTCLTVLLTGKQTTRNSFSISFKFFPYIELLFLESIFSFHTHTPSFSPFPFPPFIIFSRVYKLTFIFHTGRSTAYSAILETITNSRALCFDYVGLKNTQEIRTLLFKANFIEDILKAHSTIIFLHVRMCVCTRGGVHMSGRRVRERACLLCMRVRADIV